jgi:hypothetical protein
VRPVRLSLFVLGVEIVAVRAGRGHRIVGAAVIVGSIHDPGWYRITR